MSILKKILNTLKLEINIIEENPSIGSWGKLNTNDYPDEYREEYLEDKKKWELKGF